MNKPDPIHSGNIREQLEDYFYQALEVELLLRLCPDDEDTIYQIVDMARFLALYQGEYSRERLVGRLRTVHPKTITRLAQNGTGNVADRHMKKILSIYNGAGRAHSLPCKR